MYKLHLILKYLRKRRIAWVSLIAVMLCSTMVLVVISVMGGWLRMFREQFRNVSGDVIVRGESLVGFPNYDEMIERIRREVPGVSSASPVIRTFGLVNIEGVRRKGVEVVGYRSDIGDVNGFMESLNRMKGEKSLDFGLQHAATLPPHNQYLLPKGTPLEDLSSRQGIIMGGPLVDVRRKADGTISRPPGLYGFYVDLTVLPIAPNSSVVDIQNAARDLYFVIDDSRTKVFMIDSNSVYVSFDKLQRDLEMDAHDNQLARTSEIQISVKPGVDVNAVRDAVARVVDEVAAKHNFKPTPGPEGRFRGSRFPYSVMTWEQVHATFIGAVEKEKGLITILFGLISVVAVFLIFCIFYMIVVEKTRDIGIIKSVGATSSGVAGIFLGYGLVIGVLGAAMGFGVSWIIVHYINELHTWLGEHLGIVVWNPEVYLFDTIPNTMNPKEVVVILSCAVVSSVLGSLIPAIRAARMNPVEALRWE